MNSRQQQQINAIRLGINSQRPELVGLEFRTVEVANRIILSAPSWPDIHIGVRGGINVQIPSYPETGRPGETALDAAIWGDKLLAKRAPTSIGAHAPQSASSHEGVKSWLECAEYYLRELWCPQDRCLVDGFSKQTVTCELVNELCVKYRVNRSFEGNEIKRYQPFAEILEINRSIQISRDNLAVVVGQALTSMHEVYGKRLISAFSKALWMLKQHPVVIYDKNVRNGLWQCGLPTGEGNYCIYSRSWFSFYDRPETQAGLDEATSWLPDSSSAKTLLRTGKIQPPELKRFAESNLLRNRVTDMRLASLGGANDLFG